MGIQLGDKVRDKITGYSGIAIGLTTWLHGCIRVTVQSQELKDGVPVESRCFDEPQLEVVTAAGAPREPATTGGPIPAPQRRADVNR